MNSHWQSIHETIQKLPALGDKQNYFSTLVCFTLKNKTLVQHENLVDLYNKEIDYIIDKEQNWKDAIPIVISHMWCFYKIVGLLHGDQSLVLKRI